MAWDYEAALAARRLTRGFRNVSARHLARKFSKQTTIRLMIYHTPSRISYAQVFPFIHYHKQLWDRYKVEVRCLDFDQLLTASDVGHLQSDIVLLQPWFTIPPEDLKRACDMAAKLHPDAALSFLDSYAHSDIRLAQHLPEDLAFYIKKSLLVDRSDYLRSYRSDTPLMQYYADLHHIPSKEVDFKTPRNMLDKLRLSPNFLTAPHFVQAFAQSSLPAFEGRPLDVQTRLGTRGHAPYATMRKASLDAVHNIDGITYSPSTPIKYAAYMKEMQQSKFCFSPFGFGELCWRDIESIQAGAVMIKPEMSHLETLPDLYEPGVTYLPVKWDFSDLEAVIKQAQADPAMCKKITQAAWARAKGYLDDARFVSDMAFLFAA